MAHEKLSWRGARILMLLAILGFVAGMTFWERLWVRSWVRPLEVVVYPVAADEASAPYVAELQAAQFTEIGDFLAQEANRQWRKTFPSPRIALASPVTEAPPVPLARNALGALQWSLQLRRYAYRHTPFWGSLGQIRLFVVYHELREGERLPHSHGIQKGLLGVVHVFASAEQQAQNNVVIAHELLHTLGATDKYDAEGQPIYPGGYAEPDAQPRLPQHKAELMAGRIAVTAERADMPRGLSEAVIGYQTASEIGW